MTRMTAICGSTDYRSAKPFLSVIHCGEFSTALFPMNRVIDNIVSLQILEDVKYYVIQKVLQF